MSESWVSVERVANHLGVSTDSIYRWIAHRGMPALHPSPLEVQADRGRPLGHARRRRGRRQRGAFDAMTCPSNGLIVELTKELSQAAVTPRGSIEPADDKRYFVPIIFLSLRYEKRRAELEARISDKKSDYHGDRKAVDDPDEYRSAGAFIVPVEDFEPFIEKFMAQAEALYAEWPLAA
jgi:hypothetical protein